MSLFGEVKCGRCDRRYSALRGKCPYCGARRRKSKDAEDAGGGGNGGGNNRKWQLIAGIALLVIIVVAVVILVVTSLKPKPGPSPTPTLPSPTPPTSVTSTPIPTPSQTPTSPSPTIPSVSPTPSFTPGAITKVEIDSSDMYYPLDLTLTGVGATYTLQANVTPAGSGLPVTWRSDDTSIATVSSGGTVTAVGDGVAYVYASCGGVESAKCIIRVTGVGTATPQPSGAPTLNYHDVTLYVNPVTVGGVQADWSSFRLECSSASPVTYSSSDTSIATVTEGGKVQAVKGGTCLIYAQVDGYTLSCMVYVFTDY